MRSRLARPSHIQTAKRKRSLRRFLGFIFFLLVLFVASGLLSHVPKFMIHEVEIRNTKILDKHEVSEKVLEFLDGNKALLFARGNIFLFSKSEVVSFLKNNFPRIYEVHNVSRSGQKLLIDIEERAPAYLWCGKTVPAYPDRLKPEHCYFADQTGFIFGEAPLFTRGVYLALYGGVEAEDPVGSTIKLSSNFEELKNLYIEMEHLDFPIHSVVLSSDGKGELLGSGFSMTGDFQKVLFDETLGLSDILRKIAIAFSEEEFQKSMKERPSKLLYIDTRFKDKVFYKFQD